MKKHKIMPIPNVVDEARIQVIDEASMKWKTLVSVIDAPNPIRKEVEKLTALGHKNLWVTDCLGERRPLF